MLDSKFFYSLMWKNMLVVLDLETTGLSAKDDGIIEIALVKIKRDDFSEVDRFHCFIDPEREIPTLISQITNIFDSDVQGAKKFHEVSDEVQDFIEWFPLIWHNIPFDIRFLESHGIDTSKNPYIDTFFLANILCSNEKSLNLWYLCEVFWIELDSAHRAIDDTLATAKLFTALISKLQQVYKSNSELIWHYFTQCNDAWVRVLRDLYLQKTASVISIDLILSEYEKKLHKSQYDNTDTSWEDININIEEFLSQIPDFELRNSQKSMLDKVDKNMSSWGKLMIEAPTGIWKTFAYLLPAIKHAKAFHEPVHISTSTKALQDQIYYKDLHFLSENFPCHFIYTKLKWKRNYLWISSFLEFLHSGQHSSSMQISFILKIFLWSQKTEFWELDELQFYGEEYGYLSDIHAWNSFIFDESNPYKDIEFAIKARRRAKNSDIIITNNHILFQDIVSEWSLLWGVKNLVLDEAHSLEDIVTQSLKKIFSFEKLQKLLEKIDKKCIKYNFKLEKWAIYKQSMLFDSAEIFSIVEGEIFSHFSLDSKYKNLLISEQVYEKYPELTLLWEKVSQNLESLRQDILSLWEKKALHFSSEIQEIMYFRQFIWEVLLSPNFEKNIFYASHDENYGTQIHTTLLRPWEFLRTHLWSSVESVVLTSATLQMEDTFSYIDKTLETSDFEKIVLPSDFDYSKQALVCIPQDLWSVKNNLEKLTEFLWKFFHTVSWRTLVLFTAFFAIKEVYSRLKIQLEKEKIYLLAQWISGSKHKQIEFFKANPHNSILLGTDTFWEWIDIPGQDLQYLIIHKIPFAVPSDPIFMARSKLYKDSFWEYAIPKSILKLKQWFWRLIRTKKDTGIVVFLDDRIYKAAWWERFLSSFPKDIKIRYTTSDKLLKLLSKNK